jgi:hypothetical protein
MKKWIWIIIPALYLLMPGCKKYEDGPLMSLYSKGMRVNGTWYFERVTYNGQDSTIHYPYQQLNFFYIRDNDGGTFTWNHNIWAQELNEDLYQTGTWRFMADRDSFEMVVYRNDFRDSTFHRWKINRLAYTEFWIERNMGDSIHIQWHLIKYVY